MDYMTMFKGLSDAGILFVGSAAILGFNILVFGGLVWLWLQAGKWLAKYVHKVHGEFKEAFQKVNGKIVSIKVEKKQTAKG